MVLTAQQEILYERLLVVDVLRRLPGKASLKDVRLSEDDIRKLLGVASALALEDGAKERTRGYEIATRAVRLPEGRNPVFIRAAEHVLARLGNFPGRRLLRHRF